MKTTMLKKLLSIVLSISLLLIVQCPVFATSDMPDTLSTEIPVWTVTVNEYDMLTAKHLDLKANLESSSIKKSAQDELVKLSKLPSEDLENRGYTEKQISILRNYSGQPLENVPELRGVFANLTASFYKEAANSTMMRVRASWTWSRQPVICRNDLVAMRWKGTNSQGRVLNLAYSHLSSVKMNYYTNTDDRFKFSRTASVTCDDPYAHAFARFPLQVLNPGDGVPLYAKTGSFYLQIGRTGSDLINEAAFMFSYGHRTIAIGDISVSFPGGFDISFGSGTEIMVKKAIRMNSAGSITNI